MPPTTDPLARSTPERPPRPWSFGLTEDRLRRGWDVHSPYIVVQTDKGVMADHNDIFNPPLIAFVRAILHLVGVTRRRRPAPYDPTARWHLAAVSRHQGPSRRSGIVTSLCSQVTPVVIG